MTEQERDTVETGFIFVFNTLAEMMQDTAVQHGWCDAARNEGEMIALMHSELSEALEGFRKPGRSEHIPAFEKHEEEFADAIIRIMQGSREKGWRVAEAVVAKMRFNEQRPHKHGGKRF